MGVKEEKVVRVIRYYTVSVSNHNRGKGVKMSHGHCFELAIGWPDFHLE